MLAYLRNRRSLTTLRFFRTSYAPSLNIFYTEHPINTLRLHHLKKKVIVQFGKEAILERDWNFDQTSDIPQQSFNVESDG